MAELVSMKEFELYKPVKTIISTEIIEFIYVSNITDILADDQLMDLILSNGYYKSALCEAQGLERITISHKGIEHMCMTTPLNVSCVLDLVEGNTPCNAVDVELYVEEKETNINDVSRSV